MPDLVVSACDVAVTVTDKAAVTDAGAVYIPLVSIVPQAAPEQSDKLHVTALFEWPVTVAVNC